MYSKTDGVYTIQVKNVSTALKVSFKTFRHTFDNVPNWR